MNRYDALVHQLTTPEVRHLCWAVFSPDMAHLDTINSLSLIPDETCHQWLLELDATPAPFINYIHQREHRLLGSYFEVLWQYFVEHAPGWQHLSSRVQVNDDQGRTLGELDLLCQHPDGQNLHLELAVKFYMLPKNVSGEDANHWLGPQTKDRLDLKLNKLASKQFPFLHTEDTKATLEASHLPLDYVQNLVLKGFLFHHIDASGLSIMPSCVNSNAQEGLWCHANEAHRLNKQYTDWIIIDKPQWLGPFASKPHQFEPRSFKDVLSTIETHFSKPNYALMLIGLEKIENQMMEAKRWLVVRDDWPLG